MVGGLGAKACLRRGCVECGHGCSRAETGPRGTAPCRGRGREWEKKGMVAWASGPAWAQPLPSAWRGGDEKAEQELGEGTALISKSTGISQFVLVPSHPQLRG